VSRLRNGQERCNGLLKNRFNILKRKTGVELNWSNACKMIQSILVLHNILIIHDRVSTDFFVESEQDMNAALAEFDMGKVTSANGIFMCVLNHAYFFNSICITRI
jgi:hypothetical protein